jgi:hypothetical protein
MKFISVQAPVFAGSALLLALCAPPVFAAGGYIVKQATITSVTNTSNNQSVFTVKVSGGTGTCTNTGIVFQLSDAGDASVLNRAYAAALLALSTGMPVNIFNYVDTTCDHAAFIEVVRQ